MLNQLVSRHFEQLMWEKMLQYFVIRDMLCPTWSHAANLPVCKETVRKILHEEKFNYYEMTPVSPLNEKHISDRLRYCKYILQNGIQPIVFTDESTVVVDLSKQGIWQQWGFHPSSSFYQKDHHPIHVMVWGAIGPKGFRTDLIRYPPLLNAFSYCKLLADNRVFYQCTRLGYFVWQQDSTPSHRAVADLIRKPVLNMIDGLLTAQT